MKMKLTFVEKTWYVILINTSHTLFDTIGRTSSSRLQLFTKKSILFPFAFFLFNCLNLILIPINNQQHFLDGLLDADWWKLLNFTSFSLLFAYIFALSGILMQFQVCFFYEGFF